MVVIVVSDAKVLELVDAMLFVIGPALVIRLRGDHWLTIVLIDGEAPLYGSRGTVVSL